MPVYRLRAAGEEKRRAEEIAKKVPFFGKWLGCLFWLLMVTLVASFLTNDAVVGWIPALRVSGQVLNALCSAAYCLILLKLSSKEAEYRVGAICALISVVISLVLAFVVPVSKLLLWGLVGWMILTFRKIDPKASLLQLPYLLWLTFAAYLSAGVWVLNA
jgi:tryptophan-rich sensory protein